MFDKHHKKESPTFTGITRGVGGFGFGVAAAGGGGESLGEDPLFISYKSKSQGLEQNAVVLDSQENLIIAGTQGTRGHVVKLNSLGIRQWAAVFDVYTGEGYGTGDVAVDSSDNVYYCATTDVNGHNDLFLIKFNSSGVEQWQRSLGTSSYDRGYAVTTDSSDNVYITGLTATTAAWTWDCIIAKYNSSGTLQWQRRLEGSDTSPSYNDGAYYPMGQSITTIVASDGYPAGILVSGNFVNYDHNSSSSDDYFIARYDEDGTYRWQTYLKQLIGQEGPHAITNYRGNKTLVTDASGNIYLTGTTGQYSGDTYPHPDGYSYPREMTLVAKLSSSGSSIWARNFGDYTMHGTSIALDNSGNIYVAGTEEKYGSWKVNSGFFVKYDTNGNVLSKKYFENNTRFHYDGRYQVSADFNIWGVVTNSIGNFYLIGDAQNIIQHATTSIVIFKLQTDAEFTPSNGAVTFGTSPHSFTVGELPDATPEFDAFTTDSNLKPGVSYYFSVNPNQSNLTDTSASLTSSSTSVTVYDHDGWFGTGEYAGISTVSNWTYSTDYELSENIVTRSLIILLDAGNSSSYSGSGTTWTNIASPSTALGSPTFGNATIKSSYNTWTSDSGASGGYFTNVRAALPIPDSYLWAGYGANTMRISTMTYSVWCYPTSYNLGVLVAQGEDKWSLRTDNRVVRAYINSSNYVDTSQILSTFNNEWVHLTMAHSRTGRMRIYKNGVLQSHSNTTATFGIDQNFYYAWSFGARNIRNQFGYDGNDAFDGRIASIAIYTRELTGDEILQNYNATKTKFGH